MNLYIGCVQNLDLEPSYLQNSGMSQLEKQAEMSITSVKREEGRNKGERKEGKEGKW